MSSSRSAQAGWGHFRHHRHFHYGHFHHRHVWGWPSYSFSYYPTYSYRVYRPVYYHRSYYVPRYYVAPVVGYNCVYPSAWGWGGFYGSTNVTTPVVSSIASTTTPVAPPVVRPPLIQAATTSNIALSVNVPEDARVTINEQSTEASGNTRDFVARAAEANKEYEFVVRAEVERDGQLLTETKTVVLKAGQNSKLDFAMQPEMTAVAKVDEPVETKLTMQVPDDARVYLAGIEMKQTGNTRVFKTSQLKPGQELAGYAIRVELPGDIAGSIEREVTLVGGQAQELDLNFESTARLAAK